MRVATTTLEYFSSAILISLSFSGGKLCNQAHYSPSKRLDTRHERTGFWNTEFIDHNLKTEICTSQFSAHNRIYKSQFSAHNRICKSQFNAHNRICKSQFSAHNRICKSQFSAHNRICKSQFSAHNRICGQQFEVRM